MTTHPRNGLLSALEKIAGTGNVHRNQPLARYTSWRVGGPADILVIARSAQALGEIAATAWRCQAPCHVLGGGSNVLISDAGIRGVVVLNRAKAVTWPTKTEVSPSEEPVLVTAESGTAISTLARQCISRGLGGLEWATGIPGTVGGAVVGNAGAWGSDIAATLSAATILYRDGTVCTRSNQDMNYSYRSSILKRTTEAGGRPVVLTAAFVLIPSSRQGLTERAEEIASKRKSQPSGATCGSVFANPPGDYAGRLIESTGLKGKMIGDAEISTVHANFVINRGQATAANVLSLIRLAQEAVRQQSGIDLQLEIELIGEW